MNKSLDMDLQLLLYVVLRSFLSRSAVQSISINSLFRKSLFAIIIYVDSYIFYLKFIHFLCTFLGFVHFAVLFVIALFPCISVYEVI